MAEIVLKAPLN